MGRNNDLAYYAGQWGLSGFAQIGSGSIFHCKAEAHGACVLKLGDPDETNIAHRLLREYHGTRFCAVYEADPANGALLIERIVPGTPLRAEPDRGRRIDLFCDVWRGLHRVPADQTAYPAYLDWVSRITEYMRGREDHKILCGKMAKAQRICRGLCARFPGEMLLHGDLHHDNILLGGEGRWRVIDPKGVVGDVVFDIPRFILNEFADGFDESLPRVIQTLSEKLHVPQNDLARLTYVETCMAHCWITEDGQEANVGQVLLIEKMLED